MARLQDKVTVVTGASSGIGRAIALAFAGEGARVAVNYNRSEERAQDVVREIRGLSGQALAVQADIADPDAVAGLIETAVAEFGRIDVWVNNAGADILTGSGARLADRQKLSMLTDVDLKGTIQCCWAVADVMQRQGGGVIINMSWDQAVHGYPGTNPQMFSAVKAGIQAFSKSLAKTVAPAVRVNVLAPGWIATAFAAEVMEQDYHAERLKEIPLKRFGTPEDVAAAAVFLASDESAYITGAVLNVGGGVV
ncbi:MAG: SDR family oxidoreductase [Gammaproteobacteria bacterium]|nr:SDR family oxidoreductase [Gammaproteobacteria bacterium]